MKVTSKGRHHDLRGREVGEMPGSVGIDNTIHLSVSVSDEKVFIRIDDSVRPDFWLDLVLDKEDLKNLLQ